MATCVCFCHCGKMLKIMIRTQTFFWRGPSKMSWSLQNTDKTYKLKNTLTKVAISAPPEFCGRFGWRHPTGLVFAELGKGLELLQQVWLDRWTMARNGPAHSLCCFLQLLVHSSPVGSSHWLRICRAVSAKLSMFTVDKLIACTGQDGARFTAHSINITYLSLNTWALQWTAGNITHAS